MNRIRRFAGLWKYAIILVLFVLLAIIIATPICQRRRQPLYDREWFRKQQDSLDKEMNGRGFIKAGNAWQLPAEQTNAPLRGGNPVE